MKSKASIKSHPLHPMLVNFPIAFFIGAFLMDVLFLLFDSKYIYSQVATYLEAGGIIFGLLAAVPGIIDYFSSVPPESSAKKRATKHGLLNVLMILLFTFALLIRKGDEGVSLPVLGLESAGVILLSMAGWLGGTLVYRNQIGVDHRYADAGRWKEEKLHLESSIELDDLDKLKLNQMKLLHIDGKRIVIGRTESGVVAFNDHCTHRGGSLADGALICGTVQCPWHGSQFDIKTGELKAGPAKEAIKIYQVISKDGRTILQL